MGFYYKKRHKHTTRQGQINAGGSGATKVCPSCGHQADVQELYKDRATYKCTNCNAVNTFTRPPTDFERTKGHRPKQEPSVPIIVRDRSKENLEIMKKPEEKPEQPEPREPEKVEGNINIIKTGMQENKRIIFDYMDSKGRKSNRTIEPYKLMRDKTGAIVLYAYCLEGKGIRKFKFTGIAGVQLLNDPFMPRWPVEDKLERDKSK
jgi:hypothetical protein